MRLTSCHCIPERSLKWRGKPVLCFRCFGIAIGFQLALYILLALKYFLGRNPFQLFPLSPGIFLVSLILIVPLLIDGFSQYYGYRTSTNWLRMTTGIGFGLGMQIWVLWGVFLVYKAINL